MVNLSIIRGFPLMAYYVDYSGGVYLNITVSN